MERDEARRPRRDEKRRHRAARETTSREDAPTATRRGDATPPRASCYLLWTPLARIARAGPRRARTTALPPCVEPRDATSNLRRVPLRRVRNIVFSVWPGGRFQFYHFTHPSGSTFDRDAFQLTAGGIRLRITPYLLLPKVGILRETPPSSRAPTPARGQKRHARATEHSHASSGSERRRAEAWRARRWRLP